MQLTVQLNKDEIRQAVLEYLEKQGFVAVSLINISEEYGEIFAIADVEKVK